MYLSLSIIPLESIHLHPHYNPLENTIKHTSPRLTCCCQQQYRISITFLKFTYIVYVYIVFDHNIHTQKKTPPQTDVVSTTNGKTARKKHVTPALNYKSINGIRTRFCV